MRRAAAIAFLATLAGCGGSQPAPVTIHVRAASELADAPVEIDVSGLPRNGTATLRARWQSADGVEWRSVTPIHASDDGTVKLRGSGGMRFLTTMKPKGDASFFAPPLKGSSTVTLGVGAVHATLERRIAPDGVRMRRLTVKHDGIAGTLFAPPARKPKPAALVIGGSEGGDSARAVAGLLAAHGYPALSIAYFRARGLPKRLTRIPLEYFARAARTLKRRPGVGRVITLGGSRGGEAALLIAATFPDLVHGAIGLVPNSTPWPSLDGPDIPAWTYRDRAVEPLEPIHVERISGPVLTAAGGLDSVWNSSAYVQQIEQRLDTHHFRFPHEGHIYPDAGHRVGGAIPYLPPPTDTSPYGGDPTADEAARADLWPRILRYLDSLTHPA